MINLKLDKRIIEYSRTLVRKTNFGQRSHFNGSKSQQFLGIVAENTIRNYYGFDLIEEKNGWDGGFDIVWNGFKTDIKTIGTISEPKPHWDVVIFKPQINHPAEAYIFSSLNTREKILTITGWIEKKEFIEKATITREGEKKFLDNGGHYVAACDSYDLKILDLNPPLLNFEINN